MRWVVVSVVAALVHFGCGPADPGDDAGQALQVVSLAVDDDGAAYVVTMSSESWSGPGYGYACTTDVLRYRSDGESEAVDVNTPSDHFECRSALVFGAKSVIYFAGGNSIASSGPTSSVWNGAFLAHATSIALDPSSLPVVTWAEYARSDPPPDPPRVTRYDADLTVVAEHAFAAGSVPRAVATGADGQVAVVVGDALTMLDPDLVPTWSVDLNVAAADVEIAADGSVVVAGGTRSVDGERLPATRWTQAGAPDPSFDASAIDVVAQSLAVDGAGNVYFAGTLDVDGDVSMRVVAADRSGAPRWVLELPSASSALSIADGEAPDGFTETFLQLAPNGDLIVVAVPSGVLVRADSRGAVLWTAPIGS